MKKFYERYKHAIPLIVYAFIYLSWFSYLERTVQNPQTIIHMKWDDMIPFCEVFVIPYYLWFGYVSIVVLLQGLYFSFYRNDHFPVSLYPLAERTSPSSRSNAER